MIPVRDHPANAILARIVGLAFWTIGLGLTALAMFIVWRQIELRSSIEPAVFVFLGVVFPIAWFCTLAGWRLALNRPNRYGSIVAPWAWRTLAGIFLLLAIALVVISAVSGNVVSAAPAAGAVVFALLCFWRARMLGRLVKPVLPSNNSLEHTREE